MGEHTDTPAFEPLPPSEEEWEESWVRERGILTDIDRRYLWGLETYEDSPSSRSMRRTAIRNRFANGLLDLAYLSKLEEGEIGNVLEELDDLQTPGGLRTAVSRLVEFLYFGTDPTPEWLEEAIATGVVRAEWKTDDATRYGQRRAEVSIETYLGHNLDELENVLRAGEGHTLSPEEIGVLVRSGRLDGGDLELVETERTRDPTLLELQRDDEE